MKLPKQIAEIVEVGGFDVLSGSKHIKIMCEGSLVAVISRGNPRGHGGSRTLKNTVAQMRRAMR